MAIHDHINIGDRFNRFLVTSAPFRRPDKFWYVVCRCDCGTQRAVMCRSLANGRSGSCGCYNRTIPRPGRPTHRATYTTEFRIYSSMKGRCGNPNDAAYRNYGGRGIRVCDRWLQGFEHFYADMGARPSLHHSIDRIDNDGPYSPDNCRWATVKQQNNNKRSSLRIEYAGRCLSATEWGELTGLGASNVHQRARKGWTPEQILTTPIRNPKRKPLVTQETHGQTDSLPSSDSA